MQANNNHFFLLIVRY